jgi:putative endonuclease
MYYVYIMTNFTKLVYFEQGEEAYGAISREKQIKAGSREKKIELINFKNPDWKDLWEDIQDE